MKQIKIEQCKYFGCPEVVISGEYCFKHRRYETAVIRGYSTRSVNGKQSNQTVSNKSKLIATRKKAKTIDVRDIT
jgi:hypothetical protein